MGLIITPESELGKELAKWNKPYVYVPFPRMLYKARKRPDGIVSASETEDRIFGGNPGTAEAFSVGCQRIVRSEDEEEKAKAEGWRESPDEAMAYHESLERDIADAAAHRAYLDRNMGEKAKREAEAVDAAGMEHAPEIPEAPRRRGRPRKSSA